MKTRQTIKTGFTLIEVALVMAIATLLFMALAFGYSGRIATGRFETASNETVSFLRNIYNAVLNTENSRQGASFSRPVCTLAGTDNSTSASVLDSAGKDSYTNTEVEYNKKIADPNADYAGRTDCSIYGNLIFFGTTDGKIYNFALVGDSVDQANLAAITAEQTKTILDALRAVHLDYLAAIPTQQQTDLTNHAVDDCYRRAAGDYTTYEQSWGGKFVSANNPGEPFKGILMIIRAPATGELATYVYEDLDADETNLYDFEFLKTPENVTNSVGCRTNTSQTIKNLKSLNLDLFDEFSETVKNPPTGQAIHLGFCIDSEDFLIATSNRQKFVSFAENGQNATAIKLDETDGNPCRSS